MGSQKEKKKIFSPDDIKRTLYRLSHQILEKSPNAGLLALVGIQTRGVHLAKRIQAIIKEISGVEVPLGVLDITLYRDDLTAIGPKPIVKETKINFDLGERIVVLVDDVLYTGRTVRAALNEIIDFGRPKRVEYLVLVDRGYRELPIRADYVGKNIPTSRREVVEVKLNECDAVDEVVVTGESN